jgi:hypothetical protein
MGESGGSLQSLSIKPRNGLLAGEIAAGELLNTGVSSQSEPALASFTIFPAALPASGLVTVLGGSLSVEIP